MKNRSYLEIALDKAAADGWQFFCNVDGLPRPHNKNSNLYKAIQEAKETHPDKEVDYVVGGHRWRGTEGFHMAIITR